MRAVIGAGAISSWIGRIASRQYGAVPYMAVDSEIYDISYKAVQRLSAVMRDSETKGERIRLNAAAAIVARELLDGRYSGRELVKIRDCLGEYNMRSKCSIAIARAINAESHGCYHLMPVTRHEDRLR